MEQKLDTRPQADAVAPLSLARRQAGTIVFGVMVAALVVAPFFTEKSHDG